MRTLTVPALHGTETGGALGLSGRVDLALVQILHRPRETVQPVAEHARQEQADFIISAPGKSCKSRQKNAGKVILRQRLTRILRKSG